ncbi:MAG: hypothetical protein AAFY01_13090, partial [Pseudomonadota bacterium]
RGSQYRVDNGYAAFAVDSIQRVTDGSASSVQIVTMTFEFFRDTPPADAKPLSSEKDYCAEIPDEANPDAKMHQFVDPNSIGTAP